MESKATEKQQAAINEIGKDLAIIASAGSGKTFVLVQKLLYLINQPGFDPKSIWVTTFTEKAADELKGRILKAAGWPPEKLAEAYIGTLHSLCHQLLMSFPRKRESNGIPAFAGMTFNNILDENVSRFEKLRVVRSTLLGLIDKGDNNCLKLTEEYSFVRIMETFTDLLSQRWNLERHLKNKTGELEAVLKIYQEIAGRYEKRKRETNSLDFEDLEILTLKLLEDKNTLEELQKQFKHIFVDEAQDLNPIQVEILEKLHNRKTNRLFLVGDPAQSIYRFRGADVSLFEGLNKKISQNGGSLIYLNENFRSDPGIIDFVNRFSAVWWPERPAMIPPPPPTPSPPSTSLRTSKGRGIRGGGVEILPLVKTSNAEERRELEARLVTEKIGELLKTGFKPEDIAILFRTRTAIKFFEKSLKSAKIPFTTFAGDSLFDRPEVLETLNVMRWLSDPSDTLSMVGILLSKLGNMTIKSLYLKKNLSEIPDNLKTFLKSLSKDSPPSEIIRKIFQKRGEEFSPEETANYEKWIELVTQMEKRGFDSLGSFLESLIDLKKHAERIPAAQPAAFEKSGVRLSTVHSAKGLEFPVVILADLSYRPRSYSPLFLFDRDLGIGIKKADLTGRGLQNRYIPTPTYDEIEKKELEKESREDERLLYVALTRAKERIILLVTPVAKKSKNPSWNDLIAMPSFP